jgi:acetyl-CoA synthetase
MIPEAAVAMLACARIGAVHSVVFGGFSPAVDRRPRPGLRHQAGDHRRRRPARRQDMPLKANVDEALKLPGTNSVETVLVVRHTGGAVDMQMPRDRWYDAVVDGQPDTCEPSA